MKKILLILIAPLLMGAGCSNKSWTGYYYPDSNDLEYYKTSFGFESLEDCRDWALSIANDNENWDYECGYNCRVDKDLAINVCDKTDK
ncbi:hypothetical protein HOB10_02520 [Candidatus Parcubacteria bacterium]|jgi:hypothetical protein|nr:hypothetical protein [Candidatus Parcubacteria bacterium]